MTSRVIYKYRCWTNPFHLKILTDNCIYLPSPSEFNDPFDCASFPDYDSLDSADKRDRFTTQFIDSLKSTNPNLDEASVANLIKAKFEIDALKTIEELKGLYKEHQNRAYGIFSLSKIWDSVLMWSHYSDNHKGFCVGFDMELLKAMDEFRMGSFIKYSDEFPQIDPLKVDDDSLFKEIATKASHWAYEEEYRLFSVIRPGTNGRIVRLPDHCIKEIILGVRFPKQDIQKLRDLIGQRDVKIFQSTSVKNQFKLKREQI